MKVDHLTKRFGTFTALDDVSFSLRPGCTSLLGENGAGKTTFAQHDGSGDNADVW